MLSTPNSSQHPIVQVPGQRNPYETYHSQNTLRSVAVHGDHDTSPSNAYRNTWMRYIWLPSGIVEIVGNIGTWVMSWAFLSSISAALPGIVQSGVLFFVASFILGLAIAGWANRELMPLIIMRMFIIALGSLIGVFL